jgi:hypothetical protein
MASSIPRLYADLHSEGIYILHPGDPRDLNDAGLRYSLQWVQAVLEASCHSARKRAPRLPSARGSRVSIISIPNLHQEQDTFMGYDGPMDEDA